MKKPAPKAKDLKPKKDAKGGLSLSIKPSRITYEVKLNTISPY